MPAGAGIGNAPGVGTTVVSGGDAAAPPTGEDVGTIVEIGDTPEVVTILPAGAGDTIAFSEIKNRWVTYYSYIPDFMITNNVGLVSFRNGYLFKHNANPIYNNFYLEQSSSILEFISNMEPSAIKMYNHIFTESTHIFVMPQATNQYGQKTSLISGDFDDVEGVWKAPFLMDENTPNVDNPLIEGDVIRCHSLDITLENTDTELVKIFSVGIGVELSELTNR